MAQDGTSFKDYIDSINIAEYRRACDYFNNGGCSRPDRSIGSRFGSICPTGIRCTVARHSERRTGHDRRRGNTAPATGTNARKSYCKSDSCPDCGSTPCNDYASG